MKWPELQYLDGYLPHDMEKSYRQHYLKDDTQAASIAMLLFCTLLVAFAINDYLLFGLSAIFYFLLALRGIYLAYCIGIFAFLRRNSDPRTLDTHLFVWIILSIVMVVITNLTRPVDFDGHFAVDVVLVLMIYLALPMRQRFRIMVATVFTICDVLIFLLFRQINLPAITFAAVASLFAANMAGIFILQALYSARRDGYTARLEQQRIADEWQSTFDSITDPISINSVDYRLVRVNRAYADTVKMKPEELIGRRCFELMHGLTSPLEHCPHARAIKTGKSDTIEMFEPRLEADIEVSCSPTYDQNGVIIGTVHIVKDISERKRMLQQLEDMSTRDFLTGLPNRALMQDRFDMAVAQARRNKSRLAVVSIDLDNYKGVNDSLGHSIGDEVLKIASARLTASVRASDTVSRIGGDEFLLLLQEIHEKQDAAKIAEKIITAFQEPFVIDNNSRLVTTSAGIAFYPDDGVDLEILLKKSDDALYSAKRQGRNNFQFCG